MGIVYKAKFPDMKIEEIHKKVYAELKEKSRKLLKENLDKTEVTKGENTYYKILSENPKAYEEELQLFTVKPFYNFINSIFFKIGFSASTSIFLISIISYVLIIFLIYCFLTKYLQNQNIVFLLTFLISLFKPLLDASRHATPDNLSCFLLLLSFYLFFIKQKLFAPAFVAILCVLTRPEYFIFYTFIYIILFCNSEFFKLKVKELIISFIFIALPFLIIQYFNQISWSVLYMNQFTKVQIYPISNPDVLTFSDYFTYVKSKIMFEFNTSYFPILLIFIITILANKISFKNIKSKIIIAFFSVIYLSVLVRFFIFPTLVNRMMIGFYLLIIISLIFIQLSKKDLLQNSFNK